MADIPARMLRDAILSDDLRAFITTAGGAFTQEQIDRLNRAGVRFWGSEGIPPEFTRRYRLGREAALHPLKRAHYLPQIKVIRLLQSAVPTHIIHEIAHAWDHVRNRMVQPSRQMRRMFNLYYRGLGGIICFPSIASTKATRREAPGNSMPRAIRFFTIQHIQMSNNNYGCCDMPQSFMISSAEK